MLLLCVAMLLPSVALAQDFAIFAKQKVVVADVRDRNDRPLSDGIKKVVRQGIIDACANSNDYEVYEVSMDDIRQQLKASGQTPSFPNICKQIGKQADYIIFTEIKTSSSAVGVSANNVTLFISSNLYRIATATEVLADTERAEATSQSIIEASTRLVSRMLGITPSSQPRTQTYAQQPTSTSPSTQPTNQQSGYQSQNSYQQQSYYNQTPQNYVEDASCGLNMKMVYVDGGTLQMGTTPEQNGEGDSDETPVHSVTLDSYYIAECEVTQEQWQKVMGTTIHQQASKAGYSTKGVGNDYPMYYVSWHEAQAFCQELSAMTGKTYLLPTEAQWEYAARGGKQSKGYKYSGSYAVDAVAWYDSNSGSTNHPVKGKRANELGLYDMSGSVWEWCSDWYGSYSSSSQSNPTGASSGEYRVLRGGSWYRNARLCRVSNRNSSTPSNRINYDGFRVVCLP